MNLIQFIKKYIAKHPLFISLVFVILCAILVADPLKENYIFAFGDLNSKPNNFKDVFNGYDWNYLGGYDSNGFNIINNLPSFFLDYESEIFFKYFNVSFFSIVSFFSFLFFAKNLNIFEKNTCYSLSILYSINPLTVFDFSIINSGFYNVYVIIPFIISITIKACNSFEKKNVLLQLFFSSLLFFLFFIHMGHLISILIIQFSIILFFYLNSKINLGQSIIILLVIFLADLPYFIFLIPQIIEQLSNLTYINFKDNFTISGISIYKFFSISPHTHGFNMNKLLGVLFFICFVLSTINIARINFYFNNFFLKCRKLILSILKVNGFNEKRDIEDVYTKKNKTLIESLMVFMILILAYFLLNFTFFHWLRFYTIEQLYIFAPIRTFDKLFLYIPIFLIPIIGINIIKLCGKFYSNFIFIIISILSLYIYLHQNKIIYNISQYPINKQISYTKDLIEAKKFINKNTFNQHILILPSKRIDKNFKGWIELPEIDFFGIHPLSSNITKFLLLENQQQYHLTINYNYIKKLLNNVFSKNERDLYKFEKFNYILLDKYSSISNLTHIITIIDDLITNKKLKIIFENNGFQILQSNHNIDTPILGITNNNEIKKLNSIYYSNSIIKLEKELNINNIILKTNYSKLWIANITNHSCVNKDLNNYIYPVKYKYNYLSFNLINYKNCDVSINIFYIATFIKWISFIFFIFMLLIISFLLIRNRVKN